MDVASGMMNWRIAILLFAAGTVTGVRAGSAHQLPPDEASPAAIVALGQADYQAQLSAPESTSIEAGLLPGIGPVLGPQLPAPTGGVLCGTAGARACEINSYWDITGGRSPTDYICTWGYGPDWCNLWDARVEWLLWFSRGRNVPPLVTVTRSTGVATEYPSDPVGMNLRNGARFTLGYLLPQSSTWLEGRFWGLENGSETFAVSSGGLPILSQPILNATTGLRTDLVAAPGFGSGNISVLSRNNLFGADAWLRRVTWDDGYHRFALLAGYQYSRMDDSIVIRRSTTTVAGNPSPPAGITVDFQDTFRTQNQFNGASLGLVTGIRKRVFSLEVLGKVGLGNMRELVAISGNSTVTAPSGATSTAGVGFLAMPSNEGTRARNLFVAVPELNINGILHFSPQWQALMGYSFIYWSNSALAGNQIDPRVNLTQFPGPIVGPSAPRFTFNRSDFWVQGLSLGAEYRW